MTRWLARSSSIDPASIASPVAGSRTAPQHGLDARQQLARAEWLGDIVVRTAVEARHLVLLLRARGQQDHRQVLGFLVALDRARQLQSGLVGQHPVDQQQVRARVGDLRARFPAVLGFADGVAGTTQPERDHVADRLFVLDDQDLLARHVLSEGGVSHGRDITWSNYDIPVTVAWVAFTTSSRTYTGKASAGATDSPARKTCCPRRATASALG